MHLNKKLRSLAQKNFKRVHHFFSGFPPTVPILKFLAYIKNDLIKPSFESMLIKKMVKGWQKMKILDLGCGPCFKEQDKRFHNVDIYCVDIYKPYLKICQEYGFKTIHTDIRQIEKYFPKNSIDIVWLLDVMEHLDKKDGLEVLDKVERIAKKQIIVWVPVGWLPQDIQNDGNIHQKHRSAWYKEDFERRGYKCEILLNYHQDIRKYSKKLSYNKEPITAKAMWAILTKN